MSAARTKSISFVGPPGASCSTRPSRVRAGSEMAPLSDAISPEISRNKVVLPAPLRPTKPARTRPGSDTPARSNSRRSPKRKVRSVMASMAFPVGHSTPGAQSVRPGLGSACHRELAPLYLRRIDRRRLDRGPRPSSRGLGRRPFTAKTGVRIPLGRANENNQLASRRPALCNFCVIYKSAQRCALVRAWAERKKPATKCGPLCPYV